MLLSLFLLFEIVRQLPLSMSNCHPVQFIFVLLAMIAFAAGKFQNEKSEEQ
jgi:hypothetical protein